MAIALGGWRWRGPDACALEDSNRSGYRVGP